MEYTMETDKCIVCGAEATPKWGDPSSLCNNRVCEQVIVDLIFNGVYVELTDEQLAEASSAEGE